MARQGLILGAALFAGSLVGSSVLASGISLTGNVEVDFPVQPGFNLIVDNPFPSTPGALGVPQSNADDIDIPNWMKSEGRQTGLNFKDVRLHYDNASDTMYVGVNMFGIAGDIDGDGNPGGTDPRTQASGGLDVPNFGTGYILPNGQQGQETIVVGFDLNNDKQYDVVAGVPVDKSKAGPGKSGFSVARYVETGAGLPFGFGDPLYDHMGDLAFNPSAEHPDFEFTVLNWSKLPGMSLTDSGFGLAAFSGTLNGVIVGEDVIPLTAVSPQAIPEPATLLAWSLCVGAAAAWRHRRRRPHN